MDVTLVFDSVSQYALVFAVLVLAETIYLLLGFGAGLIAVGILAVLTPNILQDVVVILLFINLPAELWVAHDARKSIVWKEVILIGTGLGVGIVAGGLMLRHAEPMFLLTILGFFLVLAGGWFLASPASKTIKWPPWAAPGFGLVSGVFSGLFGTGGPPLIIYFQLGGFDKRSFRSHLMVIFLLVGAIRLPLYVALGLVTGARLWSSLALVPALLLGAWFGNRIHIQIPEQRFRRLVSVALVLIGVILLGREIG